MCVCVCEPAPPPACSAHGRERGRDQRTARLGEAVAQRIWGLVALPSLFLKNIEL